MLALTFFVLDHVVVLLVDEGTTIAVVGPVEKESDTFYLFIIYRRICFGINIAQ